MIMSTAHCPDCAMIVFRITGETIVGLINRLKIEVYNIGFIAKGLDSVMTDGIGIGDIIWLKHNYRDRFFADPFLLDSDEENYYVLCEEFLFFEEIGRITLLTVDRKTYTLKDRRVVIKEPTHLSFPCCTFRGYEVTPESSASGRCVRYTLEKGSLKVIKREVLAQTPMIDQVFYEDPEGSWIYACGKRNPLSDLYVYKRNESGTYTVFQQEPVLSDIGRARSAGAFFTWRGKLYRPVQDSNGRYGKQTVIMEMTKAGKDGYEAKEHIVLNSFDNPPFNCSMHTFNVYDDCIITDGSGDFLKFPSKILYRYCRFLFKNRLD